MRNTIQLVINGKPFTVAGAEAFQSLSDFLRTRCHQMGTKVVCAEGDCGSCTVLVGRLENGSLCYLPVNSCIQYLYQLDATHIVTVEGLKREDQLSPVQTAMMAHHGAQCGYCTPGFIVAMTALMEDNQGSLCSQDIKEACTGNLCRCTGYEPILKAGISVERDPAFRIHQLYPPESVIQHLRQLQASPVLIETDEMTVFIPVMLDEALTFKAAHPEATIISGGTDVHVWRNKRDFEPKAVLSLCHLKDLERLDVSEGQLVVGAKVRLSQLESYIEDQVPQLYDILNVFGSPQIKHAGTLAGNIANASPIADTLPFLFVMEAELELISLQGTRTVPVTQFYKGYKTMDLNTDELITQIRIPFPTTEQTLKLYKVSKRKHLDISTFTAAFLMERSGEIIQSARIAYGGVGPVVLRLPKTEAFLTGKPFTLDSFIQAADIAKSEITPISDVRGSSEYRNALAENMLKKFYYEVLTGEGAAVCLT